MTRKIRIMCCQGKSLDPRFEFYPYWRISLVGDDGKEAKATVTYTELREALKKILLHEFRVDKIRNRKSEYVKYRKFLRELTDYFEQLSLTHFSVPMIYSQFKDWRYEEEVTI